MDKNVLAMKYDPQDYNMYETESYIAGIFLLADGQKVAFNEDSMPQLPQGDVKALMATGDFEDWDSFKLELELTTGAITLGTNEISQQDAFGLICAVYEVTGSEYEDLFEFLGYEIS